MAQTNHRFRYFLQFVLFGLFSATPCIAQQTPAWEFFGGYSFQKSEMRGYFRSTPIIYTFRGQYMSLNGWVASATENRNRWFGATIDFSYHGKTPQVRGTTNRQRIYSLMYGPRFSHRTGRFTPFAHVLLGAARANVNVTPVGPRASDTSFAGAAGIGLDVNLGSNAAIRVLQADYFRAGLLGTRPNSYRASAGMILYLGKRE